MNLLVVTNLYPPGAGGYGRSIADFVWGLQQRGPHHPGTDQRCQPSRTRQQHRPKREAVDRGLKLKGSYEGGVRPLQDPQQRQAIDQANTALIQIWLKSQRLGWNPAGESRPAWSRTLPALLEAPCIVQHHVGFVHAPFPPSAWPSSDRYRLVAASEAVRTALVERRSSYLNSKRGLPRCTRRTLRRDLVGHASTHCHPMAAGNHP